MTWLDLSPDTGFGLDNLPYGVFSTAGTAPRTGVAIGDHVLDVAAATGDDVHATGSLNALDLLERVPGITGFRSGFLASAQTAAYLGDFRRVLL